MLISIGQVPFAVSLSLSPPRAEPMVSNKEEREHNQVLMSDVLSTHRRQGTPYALSHRWNRLHSKHGFPSAARAPLLFLTSITGKFTHLQVSLHLPPTKVIQHSQWEWQILLPAQIERNTELHHPSKSTNILLVPRLLEPVEDHAWKITGFNLFQY